MIRLPDTRALRRAVGSLAAYDAAIASALYDALLDTLTRAQEK